MSSTDVPIYVDVISNEQSIFFKSDTNAVIPNKLAFTNLHCSISSYILKGLRSSKPWHKHDSNKYQSKAFAIYYHKSDQTRYATHVNKTYLV